MPLGGHARLCHLCRVHTGLTPAAEAVGAGHGGRQRRLEASRLRLGGLDEREQRQDAPAPQLAGPARKGHARKRLQAQEVLAQAVVQRPKPSSRGWQPRPVQQAQGHLGALPRHPSPARPQQPAAARKHGAAAHTSKRPVSRSQGPDFLPERAPAAASGQEVPPCILAGTGTENAPQAPAAGSSRGHPLLRRTVGRAIVAIGSSLTPAATIHGRAARFTPDARIGACSGSKDLDASKTGAGDKDGAAGRLLPARQDRAGAGGGAVQAQHVLRLRIVSASPRPADVRLVRRDAEEDAGGGAVAHVVHVGVSAVVCLRDHVAVRPRRRRHHHHTHADGVRGGG